MPGFFAPDGINATDTRPAASEPSIADGWFKDVTVPGAHDGTIITATILNQIIANLRNVITALGGMADGSDDMIANALIGGMLLKSVYDPNTIEGDAFDMDNMYDGTVNKVLTAASKAKVDYLTVTALVDLDFLNARIAELDEVVVLRGNWNAAGGTFPDGTGTPSGFTQAGDSYIVDGGGTVDGVEFFVGDRLIAVTDNASTTVYATNWLRAGYSGNVASLFTLASSAHLYGGF